MDIDDLNIYDDLDEFHEKEQKKSNELLALEAKYNASLETINKLQTELKSYVKKIKRIEINFQNLLDTAKTEIKRKNRQIDELRKEKDDICFRRKRPWQAAASEAASEQQLSNDYPQNYNKDFAGNLKYTQKFKTTTAEAYVAPSTTSAYQRDSRQPHKHEKRHLERHHSSESRHDREYKERKANDLKSRNSDFNSDDKRKDAHKKNDYKKEPRRRESVSYSRHGSNEQRSSSSERHSVRDGHRYSESNYTRRERNYKSEYKRKTTTERSLSKESTSDGSNANRHEMTKVTKNDKSHSLHADQSKLDTAKNLTKLNDAAKNTTNALEKDVKTTIETLRQASPKNCEPTSDATASTTALKIVDKHETINVTHFEKQEKSKAQTDENSNFAAANALNTPKKVALFDALFGATPKNIENVGSKLLKIIKSSCDTSLTTSSSAYTDASETATKEVTKQVPDLSKHSADIDSCFSALDRTSNVHANVKQNVEGYEKTNETVAISIFNVVNNEKHASKTIPALGEEQKSPLEIKKSGKAKKAKGFLVDKNEVIEIDDDTDVDAMDEERMRYNNNEKHVSQAEQSTFVYELIISDDESTVEFVPECSTNSSERKKARIEILENIRLPTVFELQDKAIKEQETAELKSNKTVEIETNSTAVQFDNNSKENNENDVQKQIQKDETVKTIPIVVENNGMQTQIQFDTKAATKSVDDDILHDEKTNKANEEKAQQVEENINTKEIVEKELKTNTAEIKETEHLNENNLAEQKVAEVPNQITKTQNAQAVLVSENEINEIEIQENKSEKPNDLIEIFTDCNNGKVVDEQPQNEITQSVVAESCESSKYIKDINSIQALHNKESNDADDSQRKDNDGMQTSDDELKSIFENKAKAEEVKENSTKINFHSINEQMKTESRETKKVNGKLEEKQVKSDRNSDAALTLAMAQLREIESSSGERKKIVEKKTLAAEKKPIVKTVASTKDCKIKTAEKDKIKKLTKTKNFIKLDLSKTKREKVKQLEEKPESKMIAPTGKTLVVPEKCKIAKKEANESAKDNQQPVYLHAKTKLLKNTAPPIVHTKAIKVNEKLVKPKTKDKSVQPKKTKIITETETKASNESLEHKTIKDEVKIDKVKAKNLKRRIYDTSSDEETESVVQESLEPPLIMAKRPKRDANCEELPAIATTVHAIFQTEVETNIAYGSANGLPMMSPANTSQDAKYKEIDTRLQNMFQSPPYQHNGNDSMLFCEDATTTSITAAFANVSPIQTAHITIDETVHDSNLTAECTLDSSSAVLETKHVSLGSSDYRFEKVSDNVINLFVTRKRRKKKVKQVAHSNVEEAVAPQT